MLYTVKYIHIIHIFLVEPMYISVFFKFMQIESIFMLYCNLPFLYHMLGECFHLHTHVTTSISEDYCGVQMLAYPILHASAMKTGTMCTWLTGCFHISSIVRKAVINFVVHVSFQISVHFLLMYS